MKKELLIRKRKKAKELHDKGWSNRKIAGHLFASKDSVGKWVQMDENEILTDNRGWKKGRTRVYTPEIKQQIIKIRKDLEKENSYFFGSKVVKENYEHQTEERVSKSFVDCVLKEAGLVKSQGKKKKGRSKYMKYPEYTLTKLGKSSTRWVHYMILTNRISKIKGSFSVSLIHCYVVTPHNNSSFCRKQSIRPHFSF